MEKKKCRHKKKALGRLAVECFIPDDEPYKDGEYVELDTIFPEVSIYGHYCSKCEKITDVWIEEA